MTIAPTLERPLAGNAGRAAGMVDLRVASRRGVQTYLSPVFKTPGEVRQGSLLFLDMVEEARILHDRGEFLRVYLDGLRARLRELGARRVMRGGGYYWQLKPDLKPGELITL